MKKIGIVVGSNRSKSISKKIAKWASKQLENDLLSVDVIDLAEVDLPWLDEPELPAVGNYQNASTIAWSQKIQQYDAIVIVAPQYNWGYPAVLKNAMDTLYDEWQDLPVATVFFGGHGGFQAQLAFSLVLQGLKTNRLPVNLSLDLPVGKITAEMSADQVDVVMSEFATEFAELRLALEQLA